MKKCTRIIAVLLIALMLIPTFISCANDTATTPDDTTVNPASPDETTTASAGADSVETEPAETDRTDIKDNLPEDLDLGGKTISLYDKSKVISIGSIISGYGVFLNNELKCLFTALTNNGNGKTLSAEGVAHEVELAEAMVEVNGIGRKSMKSTNSIASKPSSMLSGA